MFTRLSDLDLNGANTKSTSKITFPKVRDKFNSATEKRIEYRSEEWSTDAGMRMGKTRWEGKRTNASIRQDAVEQLSVRNAHTTSRSHVESTLCAMSRSHPNSTAEPPRAHRAGASHAFSPDIIGALAPPIPWFFRPIDLSSPQLDLIHVLHASSTHARRPRRLHSFL